MLACQLQNAVEDKKGGIGITPYKGADRIPFLTFADDTMIFAKATKNNCAYIKNIIQEYSKMSRQKVNFHKSAFQCTKNVTRRDINSLQGILEMKPVQGLDKYLGFPIINGKVDNSTFQPVIERTGKNLAKWKANTLSKPGRVTFIHSTLESTPLFSMQSFLLPKSNLENLDRINRNFLWNKNLDDKTGNLVGWDTICKPKTLGGVGIRKSDAVNKAMQMKLLRKIENNQNRKWVDLIKAKYLKQANLFEYEKGKNCSWQWSKLMDLRKPFLIGTQWLIGNRKDVGFWKDRWLYPIPLAKAGIPLG